MSCAIRVEGLQKSYAGRAVLKGLTFTVEQGEIFALLGVNGAGKTTALECIEGLRRQDGGSAVVWGKAGIQLQSASLPAHIRPMEAVALFAKWNGTKPDAAMLDALGIGGMKKTQYGALSTGQKRRLHLALALTGRPDVVFLDEPTAGLDVEGRVALHAQIRALQAQGKTIVLASHDMAEVESLCSRIGILNRGELVFLGTVTELTAHIGSRYLVCVRTAVRRCGSGCYSRTGNTGAAFYGYCEGGCMMGAFLYGTALQWRLDIRSRTLLITCYVVPLLFFAMMGGIFTSVNPSARETLVPSMTVMGVSMGALIGLPPSLVEIYGGDIKKMYKANGVPLYFGLIPALLSTFLHLMLMSAVIYLAAPPAFGAAAPADPAAYFGALAVFTAASLSVGGVLGVAVRDQAKLTMFSQLVFLPSILLSGIMFPSELLPGVLGAAGRIFPASWGFCLMKDGGFSAGNLWPLALVMAMSSVLCMLLLKRLEKE